MGYEVGLCKKPYKDNPSYKDTVWNTCGWDKTDLYDALNALSYKTISQTESIIKTKDLSFLEDLYNQLNSQTLIKLLSALAEIDYEWVSEYMESLDNHIKTAIKLSFVLEDATPEQKAVCAELYELFYYYDDRWIVERLAKAIQQLKKENIEEIYLYASY